MKYISYMVVYECKKSADDLVLDERDEGQLCQEHVKQDRQCSSTVATWARGSEVSYNHNYSACLMIINLFSLLPSRALFIQKMLVIHLTRIL